MKKPDRENAQKINKRVSFVSKIEKPLGVVINDLGELIEYKKITHPYVSPQVKTADETEIETQATNE